MVLSFDGKKKQDKCVDVPASGKIQQFFRAYRFSLGISCISLSKNFKIRGQITKMRSKDHV